MGGSSAVRMDTNISAVPIGCRNLCQKELTVGKVSLSLNLTVYVIIYSAVEKYVFSGLVGPIVRKLLFQSQKVVSVAVGREHTSDAWK